MILWMRNILFQGKNNDKSNGKASTDHHPDYYSDEIYFAEYGLEDYNEKYYNGDKKFHGEQSDEYGLTGYFHLMSPVLPVPPRPPVPEMRLR